MNVFILWSYGDYEGLALESLPFSTLELALEEASRQGKLGNYYAGVKEFEVDNPTPVKSLLITSDGKLR